MAPQQRAEKLVFSAHRDPASIIGQASPSFRAIVPGLKQPPEHLCSIKPRDAAFYLDINTIFFPVCKSLVFLNQRYCEYM